MTTAVRKDATPVPADTGRQDEFLLVEFDDGTEREFRVSRPSFVVKYELKYGAAPLSTTEFLRAAYLNAGEPNGGSDDGYMAWVESIAWFEMVSRARPGKAASQATS